MNICVIGAGHVGLVTAVGFAEMGHSVICMDTDPKKLALLRKGKPWFFEPGLAPLLVKNLKKKRLSFTDRIADGVKKCPILFIAVGTPPLPSGEADLTAVEDVVRQIADSASEYRLIVEKSTVPVETGRRVKQVLGLALRRKVQIDVASNPEFLREGSGIEDFFHPERIVIGVETARARQLLEQLYKPFKAPLVVTDIASAELIKHSSNAFLSMKISFINAVSVLCDKVGADVCRVAEGMGLDSRIGKSFLNAGAGYGGFCFPKDLEAYIRIADKLGYDFQLLKATKQVNDGQRKIVVQKIERELWNLKGKNIGVLGLSFKPDTDDLRFSPALEVIEMLLKAQASVRVYDPESMAGARAILKKSVAYAKDAYAAARDADCLVLMTEWAEFKKLDFKKLRDLMKQPVLMDARNLYDPDRVRLAGFRYLGMGRGGESK